MMVLGAFGPVLLNWLTSVAVGVRSLTLSWGRNGLAQSMGWAPGSRVVAQWSGAHEWGRAFGLYVLAAGIGSVASYVASLLVVDVLHLSWRWVFRLPVVLTLFGGLVVWFGARGQPPDPRAIDETVDAPALAGDRELPGEEPERCWSRYLVAFSSGRLLLAGLALGFQNAARYGLLTWVPAYFLGTTPQDGMPSPWVTVLLPLGMAAGAPVGGWVSDRLCKSRRAGVAGAFLALAAVSALAMWQLPPLHPLGLPLLFSCGFVVYGPQSALWALAPDLLGRARVATAVGMMNGLAYALAGAGEPFIGWMIQRAPFSAASAAGDASIVFPIVAGFAACGACAAFLVRR